jgi:hypothetical protein
VACVESVINDPGVWFYQQTNDEIIGKAGTEGIGTIMWLVMRGALGVKSTVYTSITMRKFQIQVRMYYFYEALD